MLTFSGKGVFGGIAIGHIRLHKKNEHYVKRYKVSDTQQEIIRFHKACEDADAELEALYNKALHEIGESNAAIFEIHRMMLEDGDFIESIEGIIKNEGVNAEYAVGVTADNFAEMFSGMDDEYMKARAADVRDISERIINVLQNSTKSETKSDVPAIILAEDLAPSETVQLDKSKVLAFVTRQGSANSHTAILARTMNIPAVVNCNIEDIDKYDTVMAAVDGFTGTVYIDPDSETLDKMQKKKAEDEKRKSLLASLKGKENITLDGKKIKVYANIGGLSDLAAVLENDAGGIGLFRSEFLYLEKDNFPSEEEQFAVYKRVAQTMAGKQVIIRTMDIGADKKIGYFNLDEEENPALGYRAIRICLDRTDVFKTQLRAIMRAAAYGNIAVMYPMIISVDEVLQIKRIAEEVKAELKQQEIPYGEISQGIMIETPAAAIISDMLAKEVDFFSIGTNDLSQYTLAVDRQNQKLEKVFDPHHPAILRLIEMVVKNAHDNGIWAGICGELGADTELTETFLKMGVDELSVSPPYVLPIRKIIINSSAK